MSDDAIADMKTDFKNDNYAFQNAVDIITEPGGDNHRTIGKAIEARLI